MKVSLIAFLLICGVTIRAQQFSLTLTPESQTGEPTLLKFDDGFFTLSLDMKGMSGFSANLKRMIHSIELKKYDTSLKLVKSVKLSNGERVYGPMMPMLKIINGKLCLLYYQMPGEGEIKFFSAAINTSTLELSSAKELLDIKDKVRDLEFHMRSVNSFHPNRVVARNSESANEHKTFFFEPSPDGSKFFVLWNSGWNNHLFYCIADNELNKIRSGDQEIPDESSLTLSNAFIDNSGNAGVVYFYSKDRMGHAEILMNLSTGKKLSKEILIPSGEANSVFAGINKKDNKLYIGGTYKENSDRLTGVYIQPFNPASLKPEPAKKTVFPNDLVEIFDKEGWGSTRAKNYGISPDILFESYLLENGTMNLTGEFRRRTTGVKASFEIAGSLLNVWFNDKGVAFSRVPKVRVSAGTTFGDSYKLFEFKNKLIIFYNDHASNLAIDESKAPKRSDNYRNSVLVAAIIDESGSVKREIVIDQSKENFLAGAEDMQLLTPDTFIVRLYGVKGLGGFNGNTKWGFLKVN